MPWQDHGSIGLFRKFHEEVMPNFGFKIVDKNAASLAPILDYAMTWARPLEVGFYFAEPEALDLIGTRLIGATIPVNAHSDQTRMHAFNLHETKDLLAAHIRQAQSIGSRYSILHVAKLPSTTRGSQRKILFERILDNLERAEDLCTRLDYRLHIENDFQSIVFYRQLFESIQARGLSRLHFCFDIGHAKVWSDESLDDWLAFMADLESAGHALHCHLHANAGFEDEHLSLAEAEAKGLAAPDGDYNPYGYPAAYWRVEQRFPHATKVFEVKPERAIANYEAVLAARPASLQGR